MQRSSFESNLDFGPVDAADDPNQAVTGSAQAVTERNSQIQQRSQQSLVSSGGSMLQERGASQGERRMNVLAGNGFSEVDGARQIVSNQSANDFTYKIDNASVVTRNLSSILFNEQFSDVVLKCEGGADGSNERIFAHR